MKTKLTVLRPFSLEDAIRGILVAFYVGIIWVCFTTRLGPRIFWTMALPLLILAIVLMGFNTWRRICPLAFWGTFGVRWPRKKGKLRRVPEWMERWFFLISLVFLIIMLVVRLVVINGDGILLGGVLIFLGGLAAFTNLSFSGSTWCNFICPVGVVERIYTDPNSLHTTLNSQCEKCTACKRHCPDIDQENAYWKDVTLPSRQIAFYSFPGIVLGFYTYYFLRAGEWEAYFDGRWTRHAADLQLIWGPGFFFAPQIPAVFAAVITLVGFAGISYLLFTFVEWVLPHRGRTEEHSRHLTLSLAAFVAFNIFYLFAGAPTLRLIPGATRVVAFIVPLVSGVLLYKRWSRESEDYVKVKSAKHLLPLWKFKTPAPKDPAEIFAYFQGRNEAHAAQVSAYEEVVREILMDGVVTPRELNLLAQMRINLDISDGEHRRIYSALSEESQHLLDPAYALTVEQKLQLQGYKSALTQLLMRSASAEEITNLQQDYGIDLEVHEAVLKELTSHSGPLIARLRKQMERLKRIRNLISTLAPYRQHSLKSAFVIDILSKSQERYLVLLKEALHSLGDTQFQANLAELTSTNSDMQAAAWESIQQVLGSELTEQIKSIFEYELAPNAEENPEALYATLEVLSTSQDVYHRASVALLLGEQTSAKFTPLLRECLMDQDMLVRETAVHALAEFLKASDSEGIQVFEKDPEQNIQESLRVIRSAHPVDSGDGKAFTTLSMFEKMLFLHQVPLFADLNPDDLYELSKFAQEQTTHAPDAIVREGDMADDLYIITGGEIEASVQRKGIPHIIGTAGLGNVIGEMSVIDGQPRSATVRAATPSVHLLRISGKDFRHVLEHRSDLSAQVMRIISLRLRKVLDTI